MPQTKPYNRGLLALACFLLIGAGFSSGFFVGAQAQEGTVAGSVAHTLGIAQPPRDVNLDPLWKAWEVIDEKFVPAAVASSSTSTPVVQGTPEQRRVWGMIAGLAESLGDPYTYFLPPVEQKQFTEDLSGEFSGVGMEIANKDGILTVIAPLKGTPAERAGVKPGDIVLKINGETTEGLDITTAVNRIRGPKGSIVTLTMMREGWTEPRDIEVTRDTINVPILETETKEGVFVIRLYSFTANSPQLFRDALRKFVESGNNKLVLDLRGNPGGYLEAAVDMASWFLPSGRIVVVEDYGGKQPNVDHRSRGYDIFNENLQMIVLMDKGSASASEILAGALRDWDKATLLGTNSFGKGSVQELVEITDDTSLKITVARWLNPKGAQIPHDGIAPDIEVKVDFEKLEPGEDPQLQRALDILNGKSQ